MVRLLIVWALLAVSAGCGGDDEAIPTDRLRELVLQPEDVADGLERFEEGRLTATDLPSGARRDPARFGRAGGWKARYRAAGGGDADGMLVIESRVDLFADSEGASRDLDALRSEVRGADAELGDEALVTTTSQEAEPRAISFTTVAWRRGTVTASVLVQGYADALESDAVLELARKQDARIERASE